MEALDRYEDRGLPFVAFLLRIARNAAIDRSRKTRPDMSIDELVNHPESGQNVEAEAARSIERETLDRKSTRLNSSHTVISYAVFCLKKKKKKKSEDTKRDRYYR